MTTHVHRLNREKFIAEMAKRGWQLDPNGWIIPEGRRIHQRESDWLASILLAIECECPHPSALGAARREAFEQAAVHCPTTKSDAHETWLVCTCGWQSGTGKGWAEMWSNHILALVQ
jgi:hypothetical protein